MAADATDFHRGDILAGQYEVLGILGAGTSNLVYLARDRDTLQLHALKLIRQEFSRDPIYRKAFWCEALTWLGVKESPFVVSARAVTMYGDRILLVMDYIAPDERGRATLQDHIDWRERLDLCQVILWAIQLCHGMEHVSACGIDAHQDVTPANVLVAAPGLIKIADFGLSLQKSHRPQSRMLHYPEQERAFVFASREASAGGTPGYIAPEILHGESANVRSDIYSFGVVLGELCFRAGAKMSSPPLGWPTDERRAIEYGPKRAFVDISDRLSAVLGRCLEREAGQRWESFKHLRQELELLAEDGVPSIGGDKPVDEHCPAFWAELANGFDLVGLHRKAIACRHMALMVEQHGPERSGGTENGLRV